MIPELLADGDRTTQALFRQLVERYEFAQRQAQGRSVLDIACGVGFGSRLLSEAGSSLVVGVDQDAEAVAVARARCAAVRGNTCFIAADAHDFAHDPFDLVVSYDTLEHMREPRRFLTNLRRLVRSSGRVLLSATVVPTKDIYRYHLHDYSAPTLRSSVLACGFSIEDELLQADQIEPNDLLTSWRHHAASLPLGRVLRRPFHYARRFATMSRMGLEYRSLTLVCRSR